jgi:hypothetical protein
MPNRYNTSNSQLKITAGDGPKLKPAGSSPAIKYGAQRGSLPGKAQPRDRSLGVKKVKIYCHETGL